MTGTRSLAIAPNLNLSRILPRVMKDNPDWCNDRLCAAEVAYGEFWQLCKSFPEQKISAPPDVDEIWHAHILDSVYYHRDCNNYFTRYLHHDPCIGDSDLDGVNETLKLYEALYGVEPPPAWQGLMTCANPGQGCGSIPAMAA